MGQSVDQGLGHVAPEQTGDSVIEQDMMGESEQCSVDRAIRFSLPFSQHLVAQKTIQDRTIGGGRVYLSAVDAQRTRLHHGGDSPLQQQFAGIPLWLGLADSFGPIKFEEIASRAKRSEAFHRHAVSQQISHQIEVEGHTQHFLQLWAGGNKQLS